MAWRKRAPVILSISGRVVRLNQRRSNHPFARIGKTIASRSTLLSLLKARLIRARTRVTSVLLFSSGSLATRRDASPRDHSRGSRFSGSLLSGMILRNEEISHPPRRKQDECSYLRNEARYCPLLSLDVLRNFRLAFERSSSAACVVTTLICSRSELSASSSAVVVVRSPLAFFLSRWPSRRPQR